MTDHCSLLGVLVVNTQVRPTSLGGPAGQQSAGKNENDKKKKQKSSQKQKDKGQDSLDGVLGVARVANHGAGRGVELSCCLRLPHSLQRKRNSEIVSTKQAAATGAVLFPKLGRK